MLTLKFTHSANWDLRRLRAFIAEKNPIAAKRISARLRRGIKLLVNQPLMGVEVEEFTDHNVREFYIDGYTVRYCVTRTELVVLRVWHDREDGPPN